MNGESYRPIAVQYDLNATAMEEEFGTSARVYMYEEFRKILTGRRFFKEGGSFYVNRTDSAESDLAFVIFELKQMAWLPRHLTRFGVYRLEELLDISGFLAGGSEPNDECV